MKKIVFLTLLISVGACKFASKDEATQVSGSAPTLVTTDDNVTGTITDFKLNCEEAKFVTLLNLYRRSHHLSEVMVAKNGVLASRFHAQDMINKNYFSHTEPSGRQFYSRTQVYGYPAWSENIAAGNSSASATFCQWKNSSGHNSNMLKPEHDSIGIGRASGGTYGTYWSNNFGPETNDLLDEPLNEELSCIMPTSLPNC